MTKHATTNGEYKVPTPEERTQLRRDAGVTQLELAEEIDSTQTTISQFELGNSDMMSGTLREAAAFLQTVGGQ
jgi:transcriptional regulator with XRE-family HTH domain